MSKKLDLIGQTFGRLLVVENIGTNKDNRSMWKCRCNCGNIINIIGKSLMSGNTKSCGCLSIEISSKRLKELNKIQQGKNHPRWMGGVSSENHLIRTSDKYMVFRLHTMERDNFTCQKCGKRGGNLHIHHLKAFNRFPELRMNMNNGITLCKKCHKEFHRLYGIFNFTSDDFYEFKNNN